MITIVISYDTECFSSAEELKGTNSALRETIKLLKYRNIHLAAENKVKQQTLEEQASDSCSTCKKYKRKYKKVKGKNTYLTGQLNAVYKSEIERLQKRKREESDKLEKKTDIEHKRLKSTFSLPKKMVYYEG